MAIQELSPKQSKTALAQDLGISRSSLYYQPILPAKDLKLKVAIEQVLRKHKAYGHRRVALELKANHKRIGRVMKKYGLKPQRKAKLPKKPEDIGQESTGIPNLLQNMVLTAPHLAWQSDFTYLPYFGKFVYLATIIDSFTRKVLSWQLSTRHSRDFIITALMEALEKYPPPQIFHSDQGSEYKSRDCLELLDQHGILPSMSAKASPWENGRQESFYGKFKLELGHPENYHTLGELMEAIARQIYYYNHQRIHSALKCPPETFYQRFLSANTQSLTPATEKIQVV